MTEEYFRNLYDRIFKEMQTQFESYECRLDEFKTFSYDGDTCYYYATSLISLQKSISFLFRISIGFPKEFIISVAVEDNNSNYNFVLTDYLTYRNIEFDRTPFYRHLDNYEDMIEESKKIFVELKKLIITEEMQKLLNTDYKIDVPRDWSPYK